VGPERQRCSRQDREEAETRDDGTRAQPGDCRHRRQQREPESHERRQRKSDRSQADRRQVGAGEVGDRADQEEQAEDLPEAAGERARGTAPQLAVGAHAVIVPDRTPSQGRPLGVAPESPPGQ
jgi:hypothetical protein